MLRSEAITIIKRGVGFRPTQDATIIAALQSAQRTLEFGKTLPLWLRAISAFTVQPNVPTASFPARFIRFDEDTPPFRTHDNTGTGKKIWIYPLHYQEAYEARIASGEENDTTPAPSGYPRNIVRTTMTTFEFMPVSSVSFVMFMPGYYGAALLDADIENAWLQYAPDYIIGVAGMQVAGVLRDKDAMTAFTEMRNRGAQAYLANIVENELSGRPLIMGRNS